MRFSLATLLLVVLLIAALGLVWVQREPWVVAGRIPINEDARVEGQLAPDEARYIEVRHVDGQNDCVVIVAAPPSGGSAILWRTDGSYYQAFFDDNDTILIDRGLEFVKYRRRFPEWWWGQFYRAEVWVALVLGSALLWRTFQIPSRRGRSFGDRQLSQSTRER